MKKVLAIIALSLALLVILVSSLELLYQYETNYSNTIFECQHQNCDIVTTLNESCYVSRDCYTAYEIKPGESIRVYECWSSGQVLGEYVSDEGELDYITHSDITVQKTNSEKLRQIVISMNDKIERLENERTVIRILIPSALILLLVVVPWAGWRRLMRSYVQESSFSPVKKGILKVVIASIVLSLTVLMILFLFAWNCLRYYEMENSQKINYYYNHQECDIETTVNEKCAISTGLSTSLEIEPGESIHINGCWANGQVFGEYISAEGEIYYIDNNHITPEKTDSEELKQLVKSLNDNIDNLKKQRTPIRGIIIGVHSLLSVGVLFAIWRRFRTCIVSK